MRRYIILGIILLIIIIPVLLITSGVLRRPPSNVAAVTLTYWTVTDDNTNLGGLITAYQAKRPYVNIVVKKIPNTDYQETLLNAWARDTGPDIFSLPNDWLGQYTDFIAPLPAATNVYQFSTHRVLFRDQTEVNPVTVASLTADQLRQRFVDVVISDVFLRPDKKSPFGIYGLPLSVDTLALYYNRDLLSAAGIAVPATTWKELTNHVSQLTILDNQNNILQSGIALGTAVNVNEAADIWSLLAIQNGAQMINADSSQIIFGTEQNNYGLRALEFYTDFADFAKEVYSWNQVMPDSIDSFTQGKLAYYIGYRSDRELITSQAPTLNYAISSIPHINSDGTDAQLSSSGLPVPVSFASYWIETVSKKSQHIDEAWDFLQFATAAENVTAYLDTNGKVSALRNIVNIQRTDTDKQVFAEQAINARSWYHGNNALATEGYINSMITSVVDSANSSLSAINLAAQQITQTLTNE
ncbi:MAG: extracellular solute-binding protein [Patescibacteria group bacterium]